MTVTNAVTTNVVNTDDDNNKVEKVPETSVNNDAILPTASTILPILTTLWTTAIVRLKIVKRTFEICPTRPNKN